MTITISKRAMRFVAVIVAAVSSFAIGGVAVAAWTSTGSGSASARATTAQSSTIKEVAPLSTDNDLYPGATKSASITIDNPNSYPIIVTSISAGSSTLVNSACAARTVTSDAVPTNASGIAQSTAGNPVTIAAKESGTYSVTTHMAGTADNSCQGQDFSLALTATVQSNA